jgi:branched-subunit amino acid transport protein
MMWAAVLVAAAGCYVLKLVGLSIPQSVLANDRVRRVAMFMPIALLASLIATGTFSENGHLTVDGRLAGLIVAAIALRFEAPFLVVVGLASATSALLRLTL